jgi:hypothetical protein
METAANWVQTLKYSNTMRYAYDEAIIAGKTRCGIVKYYANEPKMLVKPTSERKEHQKTGTRIRKGLKYRIKHVLPAPLCRLEFMYDMQ